MLWPSCYGVIFGVGTHCTIDIVVKWKKTTARWVCAKSILLPFSPFLLGEGETVRFTPPYQTDLYKADYPDTVAVACCLVHIKV